jgi:hypothetical protein
VPERLETHAAFADRRMTIDAASELAGTVVYVKQAHAF